ncbi:MAG: hypothetical protein ACXIU8_13150 [Alkalilacustris sp.]
MAIIIGLSGRRGVGKSLIADHLRRHHGFLTVHPFAGGKAACRGYFEHLGVDAGTALRMTDGDLKDLPSEILPVMENGVHASPRFFMEKIGKFMATTLGVDWTLGLELSRMKRMHPGQDIVIESVVYEVEALRAAGGICVRIVRPGSGLEGVETDRAGDMIDPDVVFGNDGACPHAALERFDAEVLSALRARHDPVPGP